MITLFRRLAIGLCVLLVLLNFSWIRAASAAAVSEPCDLSLLNHAEQRVAAFFGTTTSKPWIRCPVRPRLGVGAGIGATFISPGLPSVILLGPDGAGSVDVIAHEWAHAEIAKRVGGLRRNLLMPVWFDGKLRPHPRPEKPPCVVDEKKGFNRAFGGAGHRSQMGQRGIKDLFRVGRKLNVG
ncbi:MAG: hypothetical protein AAF529_19950, partial [Pseudomonadota bacterium]